MKSKFSIKRFFMNLHILKLKPLSRVFFTALLIPLVLVPSVSYADERAIKLLNKMNLALHQLTYKGTLVLIQGNNVSSLMIDHSVVNGVQSERVVRMT